MARETRVSTTVLDQEVLADLGLAEFSRLQHHEHRMEKTEEGIQGRHFVRNATRQSKMIAGEGRSYH